MKKSFSLILVVAAILFADNMNAQTKIGYVRIDDIVSVMPELAPEKVNMDTVGQQFVKDSIMPNINYAQSEYQRKLQEYADTTKPPKVRETILSELKGLQEELNGADSFIQQVLQSKQQEFLRPFYAKAKKAIDTVAKKKGYTHILSTDVLLVAPEADDISLAVLTELNIKLPNQPAAGGAKPAGGGAKTGN